MLRFSQTQMDQIEDLSQASLAERLHPLLEAEFGAQDITRAGGTPRLVKAADRAGMNSTAEIYRFLRILCAVAAPDVPRERCIFVTQAAVSYRTAEDQLRVMERTIFAAERRDLWRDALATGSASSVAAVSPVPFHDAAEHTLSLPRSAPAET